MGLSDLGRRAWADLGGDPADLGLVEDPEPPLGLPARLDVAGLLSDSVGLATLALQQVQAARGQEPAGLPVRVAGDRVTTSAQSERHLLIDGVAPQVWAPLSGFWPTRDGWVRTHGNYPHHARRLAGLLGVPADAERSAVASAISAWDARALEDAAAGAGAVVGAVRRPEEWAAHAHAATTADAPLVDLAHDAGAPPRGWTADAGAPLAGVRVLDLTRVIAGPVATRDLAFAGAEVLRVDSPRLPELPWQHVDTGPGKRSTQLDLDVAADRRAFDDLLRAADVVVTGYRPGSLDRHGLAPEALRERSPDLVVARVSAWGVRGPWAHRRGFDSIVQAVTGIAVAESPDGTRPGALPAQALDHSAGHFLAAAVAHCLRRQREVGGSWSVAVALARIAQELLGTRDRRAHVPTPEPTTQEGTTTAGRVRCPAPALTYTHAPATYPALARPWGADAPTWQQSTPA